MYSSKRKNQLTPYFQKLHEAEYLLDELYRNPLLKKYEYILQDLMSDVRSLYNKHSIYVLS